MGLWTSWRFHHTTPSRVLCPPCIQPTQAMQLLDRQSSRETAGTHKSRLVFPPLLFHCLPVPLHCSSSVVLSLCFSGYPAQPSPLVESLDAYFSHGYTKLGSSNTPSHIRIGKAGRHGHAWTSFSPYFSVALTHPLTQVATPTHSQTHGNSL